LVLLKANIPISNDGNFEVYKDVKGESFYFGTFLKEVFDVNDYHRLFNRRFYPICYFKSLEELKKIKFLTEENEIKYAVNHPYSKKYKEKIKKEVGLVLENFKVDYLIIEDFDLVELAEKYGVKVFLSTRIAPLNKEEAKFYYKLLGKSLAGFVLPRQFNTKEINEVNKFAISKNLKIEIFFELGGCLNEERFCFFHEILDYQKNKEKKPVKYPICYTIFFNSNNIKKETISGFPMKDYFSCRSCLLPFIKEKENVYLKIVGRCYPNERNKKIYDYLKKVRENLKLINKEKIISKNRLELLKTFGKLCNKDLCPTFDLIIDD